MVPQLLDREGTFLCSGIIDTRGDEVAAALEQAGLLVTTRREKNGWIALKPGCDDAMRAVVRPSPCRRTGGCWSSATFTAIFPFSRAC
ncbi:MAG: 50S ribosomal protein L11 methyltransferase [Evtepia gabavorous]